MNNKTPKNYNAPDVKVIFIRTDHLCVGSQTETATRENYYSIDMFE